MVYFTLPGASKMFRTVNMVTARNANAHIRWKNLIALRDIKRGELITLHPLSRQTVERIPRSYEERREVDRLAKVAYEHASELS